MARGQSGADFERVNVLVAGGMKKMQAFAAVAEERGVSANGVRVNYYNASRKANSASWRSPLELSPAVGRPGVGLRARRRKLWRPTALRASMNWPVGSSRTLETRGEGGG